MPTLEWCFYWAIIIGLAVTLVLGREHYVREVKWRDGSIAQLVEMNEGWAKHCQHWYEKR